MSVAVSPSSQIVDAVCGASALAVLDTRPSALEVEENSNYQTKGGWMLLADVHERNGMIGMKFKFDRDAWRCLDARMNGQKEGYATANSTLSGELICKGGMTDSRVRAEGIGR